MKLLIHNQQLKKSSIFV